MLVPPGVPALVHAANTPEYLARTRKKEPADGSRCRPAYHTLRLSTLLSLL
jgi:hypothetical protein